MRYSALIGNPVEHSVSDYMFQLFAEKLGFSYGHLKIQIPEKKNLRKSLKALSDLNFKGINITLPYKLDTLEFLDEADETVRESGAVNTIKIKDGKYIGFNTDCFGFIESCNQLLKPIQKSDTVFIFGAGGAARAIIQQATKYSEQIYVFNRNVKKLKKLKKEYGNKIADIFALDERIIKKKIKELKPTYYFNATSLGMVPDRLTSPLNSDLYSYIDGNASYFLDAVFNPYKTLFIQDAERIGAPTAPGIYWMIYQGIIAFNIWNDTNLQFSKDEIEAIAQKLIEKLEK